jgi:hypothetical protein
LSKLEREKQEKKRRFCNFFEIWRENGKNRGAAKKNGANSAQKEATQVESCEKKTLRRLQFGEKSAIITSLANRRALLDGTARFEKFSVIFGR